MPSEISTTNNPILITRKKRQNKINQLAQGQMVSKDNLTPKITPIIQPL